jgi:predicted nucleotidyltransferase
VEISSLFVKYPGIDRLPVFRSDTQAAVLTELFVYAAEPLTLTELATRTGYSVSAVHKEAERLEAADLVRSTRHGRNRLVSANQESPFASELRSLLVRAFGPASLIRRELVGFSSIVEGFIYGSWARSDYGVGGQPNDIDLMIIGDPDLTALYDRLRDVERRIGRPIQVTVLTPEEWANPASGFLKSIRDQPTVPVT